MNDDTNFQQGLKDDLHKLKLDELENLILETKNDLVLIKNALDLLDQTESKMQETGNSLRKLQESKVSVNKEVLLPLTNHLFVEGRITDTKGVLVELGADYVVYMGYSEALECLARAVLLLDSRRLELMVAAKEMSAFDLAIKQTMIQKSTDECEE